MYGRMAEYPVNRGIGKPVEFKGLKSQYLFIFAGGLLAVFVVFIVLFMAGVNQWVCIAAARVADVPAQCPVRHIRADEDSRLQTASPVHHQPQGDTPAVHL